MNQSLPVLNLEAAKYECIFGRGCDGLCCRNGRPGLYPEDVVTIDAHLERVLPLLRPQARALVEEGGYLSNRRRRGLPMLRVLDGWCVFFNQGCTLHKLGAAEGDAFRYKPVACALFPLARTLDDHWYIRQKDYQDEDWDLFCLDPASSPKPASESLREEIALAARITAEEEEARRQKGG
jgi:hypothetical protein